MCANQKRGDWSLALVNGRQRCIIKNVKTCRIDRRGLILAQERLFLDRKCFRLVAKEQRRASRRRMIRRRKPLAGSWQHTAMHHSKKVVIRLRMLFRDDLRRKRADDTLGMYRPQRRAIEVSLARGQEASQG